MSFKLNFYTLHDMNKRKGPLYWSIEKSLYTVDFNDLLNKISNVLSKEDTSWLWHCRLGHASIEQIRYHVMSMFMACPN